MTMRNVVQPDILFISGSRRDIMLKERIDGPCDLVVEIMSPANRRKDRLQKMEIYRKAGIPHYWLVDPEENTLEAFVLKGENYALIAAGAGGVGDKFTHPDFPGLDLDLDKVLDLDSSKEMILIPNHDSDKKCPFTPYTSHTKSGSIFLLTNNINL
ncbi:MAG: Uma2 family endonuclease [Desulfitobacteriaceae bacterium]